MEFIDANKIEAIFDSRKKNTNLHHVSAHRTNVRYPNQLHRWSVWEEHHLEMNYRWNIFIRPIWYRSRRTTMFFDKFGKIIDMTQKGHPDIRSCIMWWDFIRSKETWSTIFLHSSCLSRWQTISIETRSKFLFFFPSFPFFSRHDCCCQATFELLRYSRNLIRTSEFSFPKRKRVSLCARRTKYSRNRFSRDVASWYAIECPNEMLDLSMKWPGFFLFFFDVNSERTSFFSFVRIDSFLSSGFFPPLKIYLSQWKIKSLNFVLIFILFLVFSTNNIFN